MMENVNKRLSTGIPGLDEMMEGGFMPNDVIAYSGGPGTGKSTTALRFLLNGMDNGENTMYISLEEEKDKFFRNMATIGVNLQTYEDNGNFIFERIRPTELAELLKGEYTAVGNRILDKQVKRLVIDSITSLSVTFKEESEARREILNLIERQLPIWKVTTILISETSKEDGRDVLDFLTDGVIKLYYKKQGRERTRSVEILKYRGTDHSENEVYLQIGKDGVEVYPEQKI